MLLNLLDQVRENANVENAQSSSKSDSASSAFTGNKMDAFNLAMVFGPNLLQASSRGVSSGRLNDFSNDKYNLIDDIDSVISVTKYLIENQNEIFHVS